MEQGKKHQKILDLQEQKIEQTIRRAIPRKPKIYPNIIYKNLNNLREKLNEKSGIEKEHIPVIATIIISIGLTRLALTAASPRIRAPTIPIVVPNGPGTRSPASRISSKENSIKKISKITGKGTAFLEAAMVNKSSVGSNSE